MLNGECQVAATTWEWKEEIDEERAKKAKERAEERLNQKNLSEREQRIAEAKLRRALVRLHEQTKNKKNPPSGMDVPGEGFFMRTVRLLGLFRENHSE